MGKKNAINPRPKIKYCAIQDSDGFQVLKIFAPANFKTEVVAVTKM